MPIFCSICISSILDDLPIKFSEYRKQRLLFPTGDLSGSVKRFVRPPTRVTFQIYPHVALLELGWFIEPLRYLVFSASLPLCAFALNISAYSFLEKRRHNLRVRQSISTHTVIRLAVGPRFPLWVSDVVFFGITERQLVLRQHRRQRIRLLRQR